VNTVILYDPSRRTWLLFSQPRQVIQASNLADVIPALTYVESQVNQGGLHAAGFVSYEASPAFDPALQVHALSGFPLLWFGLYDRPQEFARMPGFPSKSASPPQTPILLDWQPTTSQAAYSGAIATIREHIAHGDTYQVNFTIRLQASFAGQPWDLFVQMANAQGAAAGSGYAAFIDAGDFAICSASPELFFCLQGNELTSKPMKGTTQRGLTLAQDRERAAWLHHSEKNRAENVMIVDMMRNDMGRVAHTGSVHVPRLFITERYPTVWQMTSTVRSLTEASLVDIFGALFPCASITGAPKASTMRIIKCLEDTPRSIYTGCIGTISPNRQAQFNVAIRTALVDRAAGRVEYGVGGGIIWDSTAEDEYNECLLKANLLHTTRPSFDILESLVWLPPASLPPGFPRRLGDVQAENGGYILLEPHLTRLAESAEYFNYALDIGRIRQMLTETAAALPGQAHKVRLLVSAAGEITVQSAPLQLSHTPARLGIAPSPINPADPFLYHKTTRREVYEQALAACPGGDDVVLWNPDGEVTETCNANLLVWLEDAWCTPPVRAGLLAGTLRNDLLAHGEVKERTITLTELRSAAKIDLVNSVRGRRQATCL
jgi:para-aminobenzoate synthetase/4-amino-4-deoxychorismate lyase